MVAALDKLNLLCFTTFILCAQSYKDKPLGLQRTNHPTRRLVQEQGPEIEELKKNIQTWADPRLCDARNLVPPTALRIWLFSTVSCDVPDTWLMLQHWYRHYLMWGFERQWMLIVVHQNTTTPESDVQCEEIKKFFDKEGVAFIPWNDAYRAPALTEFSLEIFKSSIVSPFDWIVYADNDEFHDYGSHDFNTVQEFAKWLEDNQYDAAVGKFRDHLSAGGQLTRLGREPMIWEQFPLECDLINSGMFQGKNHKTLIYRAYFRTGNGNHEIVPLEQADWYFGPYPPGETTPRNENNGSDDIRDLTPYMMYNGCYINTNKTVQETHPGNGLPFLRGKPRILNSTSVKVHHFKWHRAVITAARNRMKYYAGDMYKNGSWDWSAKPRMQTFFMSKTILETLEANNASVPLERAACWGSSPQTQKMIQWMYDLQSKLEM